MAFLVARLDSAGVGRSAANVLFLVFTMFTDFFYPSKRDIVTNYGTR